MSGVSEGCSIKWDLLSKARDPISSDGDSPSSEQSPDAGTVAGHPALEVVGRKVQAGDSLVGLAGERRILSGGSPTFLCSFVKGADYVVGEAAAKGEQSSGVRPLESTKLSYWLFDNVVAHSLLHLAQGKRVEGSGCADVGHEAIAE